MVHNIYINHYSSQLRGRCNTRDIDTGTNSAYDKETDVKMNYVSNQGYDDDDDYEEIHSIPMKKAKSLVQH